MSLSLILMDCHTLLLLPEQRDERILGHINIRHRSHLLLALCLIPQQLHPPGHIASVLKWQRGRESLVTISFGVLISSRLIEGFKKKFQSQ